MTDPLLVPRSAVILLNLPSADDGAAIREIDQQLPPAFAHAAWVRSGKKIAVWAPEARTKLESETTNAGLAWNGAALAPNVLPDADGQTTFWLVPPRRWTTAVVLDRLRARERVIAAGAAMFFATGVLGARAATSMDDRLTRLETERRTLTAARMPAVRGNTDYVAFLQDVAGDVPRNAHLVDIAIDGALRTVRIRGRGADYSAVSTCQRVLSAIPRIHEVRTTSANLVKVGGTPVVEFVLEGRLR